MLKNAIAPIQAWLMSQGRCVADGKPLSDAKRVARKDGTEMITHSCGRVFIHDPKTKRYRRALMSELDK